MKLKIGDEAPEFELLDAEGRARALSDFRGRRVLVYFYPRADTPGCTKQACSLRDGREELARRGVAVVGISPDKPEKLRKFDEKHGLGFELLSDPDHAAAEAWGAWGEKKMYGKTTQGIIRSSFVVDEQGRIAQVSYKVKPLDTLPEALAALGKG